MKKMKPKLGNRAQASAETLLLIGAAVVIAMTVGLTLKAIFSSTSGEVTNRIPQVAQDIGNTG